MGASTIAAEVHHHPASLPTGTCLLNILVRLEQEQMARGLSECSGVAGIVGKMWLKRARGVLVMSLVSSCWLGVPAELVPCLVGGLE